jgi:hypothetical protein
MKIKITAAKCVRFTQAIVFRQKKPRVGTVKPDDDFAGEITRRKKAGTVRIF